MAAIASPRRSAAHRRLTAECPSTSDFFFFFSLFFGWKFHFISFHSSFFFVNDFSRTSDAAGTEKAVGRNGKKKKRVGNRIIKKNVKEHAIRFSFFFVVSLTSCSGRPSWWRPSSIDCPSRRQMTLKVLPAFLLTTSSSHRVTVSSWGQVALGFRTIHTNVIIAGFARLTIQQGIRLFVLPAKRWRWRRSGVRDGGTRFRWPRRPREGTTVRKWWNIPNQKYVFLASILPFQAAQLLEQYEIPILITRLGRICGLLAPISSHAAVVEIEISSDRWNFEIQLSSLERNWPSSIHDRFAVP